MVEENNHHRETWTRSLTKTITYRVMILVLDFTVIYLLTGKYKVALGFMLISNLYTSLGYYLHERMWVNVKWGKK